MSVIPSSGSISLGTVQNEFGGTNPISLGEYYRNGAFVTPNNSGVPTSGAISLSSFRGTYKTSTAASIVQALYTDANYGVVRNQLFSRTSYGFDMEVNTATEFNDSSSASFRYSTSVSYSRTWPTTFNAAFDPMLSTSGITVVMRNVGDGALTNSLSVGGIGRSLTDVFNAPLNPLGCRISYAIVDTSYNGIAGLNIGATYGKGSSNNENLQELFVLPGRWTAYWATPVVSGLTSTTIPTVSANDIVFTIRSGYFDQFSGDGTFSGTAGVDLMMKRNSRWYDNTTSFVHGVTSTGSLTFVPGRDSTTNSSGVTTYYNHAGMMVAFTCTQV